MSFINAKDVEQKLGSFGVVVGQSDRTILELTINAVEEYIQNYCNLDSIPQELYYTAVDICCGTFLKTQVSINGNALNGAVSSITEGDVSIGFREGTSSTEMMNNLINNLINKKGELECYRKLKW